MPSFATEVKNEIARLMYDAPCDRTAEMAALLRMGGTITFGPHRTFGVNFTTENAAVARKMLNLLKLEGEGVRTEISARRARRLNKHNNYLVRIVPSPGVEGLLEHLGLMQGGSLNLGQEQKGLAILRKNCCRAAYLRGAFLGGGSVNRPEAHYHLELVAPNYAFAHLLHTLMRRLEFPAGIAERRRDKAEDAGLIIHQQAHVVGRLRLFQRAETLLLIAGAAHAPKGIIDDIAGDIDDICDNS